jgi:hypothetical protein
MKKISFIYCLAVLLSGILVLVILDGRRLISLYFFEPRTYGTVDQTSAETKDLLRQEAIKDSLNEVKRNRDFRVSRRTSARSDGYDIVRTKERIDSTTCIYSVLIQQNDSVKFRTGIGVYDSNWVIFGLYRLIPNGRNQVVIEEFTGGAHCCYMYWIVDLARPIKVVYHSDENETEIGYLMEFEDFDGDGSYEFTQILNSFHYFDRLCGACSPAGMVVLKYSEESDCFEIANRTFPSVVLKDVEKKKAEVKALLDTKKPHTWDYSTELLSGALDVLIHHVYAGQDSIGWAYFDENYALSDKSEMKKKIQAVLESSVVYQQLYQR